MVYVVYFAIAAAKIGRISRFSHDWGKKVEEG
jgi:hypothetical protein